ncbi:hypothetical protein BDV19DRAFT_375210 [Aspergillus venezuelensis]
MPLKIIIVAAGLAGLGAAIALVCQGHNVMVGTGTLLLLYSSQLALQPQRPANSPSRPLGEQSTFLNGIGAAIHVPPMPVEC